MQGALEGLCGSPGSTPPVHIVNLAVGQAGNDCMVRSPEGRWVGGGGKVL